MNHTDRHTASDQANAFIVRMMNELNARNSADDICTVFGSALHSYLNCIITITDYRSTDDSLGLHSVWGVGDRLDKIAELTGFDPLKKRYRFDSLDDKHKELFAGQNLIRIEGGVYDYALGKLTGNDCDSISELLEIKFIYAMGFFWNNRHYGGVSILAENELGPDDIFVIESLTHHVSILLSRLLFDKYFIESETKFRQFFIVEPDALLIFDRQTLVIIDVNDAACEMYGYSRDEFVGRLVTDITNSPADAGEVLSKMQVGEKIHIYNRQNVRSDGSVFYVDAAASLYYLDERETVCLSVRDVSDLISGKNKITDNVRSLKIISWITNSLNECHTVKDILRSLGTGLSELAPEVVFIVSELDVKTGYSTILKTVGPGWVLKAASKILNIESNEYKARIEDLRPEDQQKLRTGKVEDIEGGLYHFSLKKIVQPFAAALEKMLSINHIYAIGLNLDGAYYGGITMLSKKALQREEKNIIEMLVRQATVHIAKIVQKETISESEERFRSLVENAPVAVFVQTDEKFTYVNRATIALFEATGPGELINTPIYDRFHPDFREIVKERIKLLNNEKKNVRELEEICLKMDGRKFDVFVSAVPIRFGGKDGALVFMRDITREKNAKKETETNEKKYRLLAENSRDVIWSMDMDLNYTYISPSCELLTGFTAAEIMRSPERMFSIESLRTVKKVLHDEMAAEGKPGVSPSRSRRIEVQQLCRNGSSVWVESHVSFIRDENGRPVGFLGVTRSIMERKLAEEALMQSEELYRTLVHVSPDIIVITDMNGIISFVSPRAEEVMRQDYSSGVGSSVLSWLMPEYHALAIENIEKTFTKGTPLSNIYRMRRPDNTTFWGEINGAPLYHVDGKPKGLVAIVRDVTRRVEAEERIRNINIELEAKVRERTSKLELLAGDLESFSYSVSHDLRTPLRSLDGFANILIDDYAPLLDDEGKRLLRKIMENAQKMGTLIDDLLEFSQIGRKEIRMKLVDIKKMVHQVYGELLPSELVNRITMTVDELPYAFADEKLLRQVLVNLISNALKYSAKNEKIEIHVSGYEEKGEMVYSVADNGVGFNMQFIDKLFVVFQRLHRSSEFEGTGVGLAIVKQIITRHGGRVWAKAEPDKGATFYFSLPLREVRHEV